MPASNSVPACGSSSPPPESSASDGLGLSSGHNSTQRPHTAKAEWTPGGSHNRICYGKIHPPKGSGGSRGKVVEFSRKSRKRLLDTLNGINKDLASKPLFLTLTYSDKCAWQDGAIGKKHLEAFQKRLFRRWGKFPVVWKLEVKDRKSGVNVGAIVPHFHLLAFANLPLDEFRSWLSVAWYEVVGSGDPEHFAAGTAAEQVRSWNGVHAYAAKYMGKLEKLIGSSGNLGRVWGIWNKKLLPIGTEAATMTIEDGVRARRVLARWSGRSLRSRSDLKNFSCYAPASLLARLAASWGYSDASQKGGGYREWKEARRKEEAHSSGYVGDRGHAPGAAPPADTESG